MATTGSFGMTKVFSGLAAILAVASSLTLPAHAAPGGTAPGGWNINLGAGGSYSPDYEGSDRYKFRPLPMVQISYDDLFAFNGRQLTVPLLRFGENRLQIGAIAQWASGRDESDNRADLKGLGDIGPSAELGGFARLQLRYFWLGVDATQDVAGGHKGYQVHAALGTRIPLSTAVFARLTAETTWAGGNYMSRFYGVSAAQSLASGLPVYAASAGLKDVGVSGGLTYLIDSHWSITGGARFTRLLGDAADAPLVRLRGSENQFSSYLFVGYAL